CAGTNCVSIANGVGVCCAGSVACGGTCCNPDTTCTSASCSGTTCVYTAKVGCCVQDSDCPTSANPCSGRSATQRTTPAARTTWPTGPPATTATPAPPTTPVRTA